MHISELRVRHFRNFRNARFIFQRGVNTLIGENGSGKTNALYALRLLLDESLARNALQLRESDFCRALRDWHGHWMVIAIDFAELDPAEGCQLLKHGGGHMDGTESGTLSFYFRPKRECRKWLHEKSLESGSDDEISTYLQDLTVDSYEPVVTGRAQADILDDDVYRQVAGDLDNYSFPNPAEDDQALLGVPIRPIYPEITCTFAQALRDVIGDLRGYRRNPLLAVLRGAESEIKIEDADSITHAVSQLNRQIAALPEIRGVADGVQSTLHTTVGHTFSPSVGIESGLPDRMDKLLQRLSVTVGDDDKSVYRGDLTEQSLGGANLIYLALKLLEYELKLSGDRVAHFLLIEEPESHIHTHIQKTLFVNQETRKTQVIVSTHSTHISSVARVTSVNVLARSGNCAEVYQPATGLNKLASARLERYLDAVRSTLLFAKGVVLVEGEAELIMFPALVKSVFGVTLDELGISVISMDSAFFNHVAVVFHDERIRRRCAIVTDLDAAFLPLPKDPNSDDASQRRARAAQEAGESRKKALETFTTNNRWTDVFLATHTFEVDFIRAGNAPAVARTLQTIYAKESNRKKPRELLHESDLAKSGREVLRLAEKVGKGWFALLLAEQINATTRIPGYVLRAIAFAGQDGITPHALQQMGLFRIANEGLPDDKVTLLPPKDELEGLPAEEFTEIYTKSDPGDALSLLVAELKRHV